MAVFDNRKPKSPSRHHHSLWFSPTEERRFRDLCRKYGFEGPFGAPKFSDFVRFCLREISSRTPESQGKVRVELDPDRDAERVSLSQQVLAEKAYALQEAWRGEPNPDRRAALRSRFAALLDAAHEWSAVLEKFEQRRHVLESGLRQPRHRRKGSSSPATASSSETMDAPTG